MSPDPDPADVDRRQIRETVLMLELASAQIAAAMRDSGQPIAVLTDAFTGMIGHLQDVATHARAGTPGDEDRAGLLGAAEEGSRLAHEAIVAFQFYDRLSQRLAHVEEGLGALAELIGNPQRVTDPAEWVALQRHIRSRYTTPEENAMFDAVMHGIPVHEAIGRYRVEMRQKGDDIEFF